MVLDIMFFGVVFIIGFGLGSISRHGEPSEEELFERLVSARLAKRAETEARDAVESDLAKAVDHRS